MSDFKRLLVWQKAHALSLGITRMASRIRGGRWVSLRSQMIRAAGSIPANIVEGRAMAGSREFARFVGYAIASSSELEYHLLAAHDLGLIHPAQFRALMTRLVEVRKMLYGLQRRLRRDEEPAVPSAPMR